jgi:type VI secretion system secreted protein VgrG
MAQPVKATLELDNGKKLNKYQNLVIGQDLFGHHHFEIIVPFLELEKQGESFFNSSHKDVCGKPLTVSFEPAMRKGSFDFQFKGIITEILLSNLADMSNVFLLRGYSPTILLTDCSIRRTFLDKTIQQIFDSVLSVYPGNVLKKKLNPRHTNAIKYCVQYDETNFAFLSRIAAEYGEWFYYDGKEVVLGDSGGSKEVDFLIDGIQSFDMSISLMPAKFKLSSYDYTKDQSYSGDSSSQSVDGLSQFGKFALDESENLFSQNALFVANKPVYSQNELDELIKFRRSCVASNLIVFHGRGENPDIFLGSVINVSGTRPQKGGRGSKESYGKYRITEIRHQVDGGGNYAHTFKAVPETVKFPPVNPHVIHPVAQPELAVVKDNNDPDKLSRVKVEFNWPGDDKDSDWIRVGTFYAGNDNRKGMQFIPEKEAQVLVDYELNRPENPFVASSFYPKKSGMRALKGSNDEKVFYTQAGNMITLTDKSGSNSIEITNENKTDTSILIEFKDDGCITMKTNGKVQVQAQDSITLKAQQKLSLEAQDIEINAQNGLTCKGQSSVKLSGAQVEISADSSAKVSGAQTEIDGSATLALKGALVQIN